MMGLTLPHFPPFRASDKIRIGFISPCLVNGGAETWQASLARSLDDRFEVVGVAVNGTTIDSSAINAYQGLCPVSQGPRAIKALAMNSDILVTWGQRDYASAWRNDPRKPYLLSVSHLPPGSDSYGDIANVDGFVAVSDSALLSIPEEAQCKTSIIANAFDPARLAPTRSRAEVRASWGIGPDEFVVGFLGRLSTEKNPQAMVDLAREAATKATIVVVGSGALAPDLEAQAKILDNLRVVGPDSRAGDVLRAFDTLVVPSRYESYGLSIVEALVLEVPVISTSVGVAREFQGLTRIVADPTGKELWQAISQDLEEIEGTRSRVKAAQAWAIENASLEDFARKWSDHLASLVPARPPGLMRMALNFGSAVMGHIAGGMKTASAEVQADRERICRLCPKLDQARDRCTKCGCIAMKMKRSWASQACPEGRWLANPETPSPLS
jgi:glycosyltransferase involved in cell wall biosynthesis